MNYCKRSYGAWRRKVKQLSSFKFTSIQLFRGFKTFFKINNI